MVSAVRLNTLLDDLDRAGLDAGPAARQQAHMLYMLLASEQTLDDPNAERRLVDHLRPLIIRSREQSAAFERVVTQWGVGVHDIDARRSSIADAAKAASAKTTALPKPMRSFPIPIPWLIGAFAVLFLMFFGLTRLTEPTSISTDPIVPVEPEAPIQIDPNPTPTVIAPPEEIEEPVAEETSPVDLDSEGVFALVIYDFILRDFAPTLRELKAAGLFETISLDELRRMTGLPPDQPIPLNQSNLRRIAGAAVSQIQVPDDTWSDLMRLDNSLPTEWILGADERIQVVEELERDGERMRAFGRRELDETLRNQAAEGISAFDAIEVLAKPFSPPTPLIEGMDGVVGASFSSDYSLIAASDPEGNLTIWNVETQTDILSIETSIAETWWLEFSEDDRLVFVAGQEDIMVFDAVTGEEVFSHSLPGRFSMYPAFSTIADRVVTSSLSTQGRDRSLRLWSMSTGREIAGLDPGDETIALIEFSPSGEEFFVLDSQGAVQFRDAQTGNLIEAWPNRPTQNLTLRYAPDGENLLGVDADETLTLFSRETGLPTKVYDRIEGLNGFLYSTDHRHIVAVSGDNTLHVFNTETAEKIATVSEGLTAIMWADVSPNGERIYALNMQDTVQALTSVADTAWPLNQDRVWTTAELAEVTRASLADEFDITLSAQVSDARVVRQVAALAYQRGDTLILRDPPWAPDSWHGVHEAHVIQRNAPWFAALTLLLIGIGAWLWSAFNMRAYLQRRRPGDPGRVIELFSDTRHQADKVQNAIRRAAKALLQRQPGHERLDIKASIKATAKARGLFTPVEKRDTRMPEYLFLIDARSRADHETQRTLDYLDRLRKEHVPITHYFYERAPDRVRASMGAPSQSLDLIASEHSDKRLVLVGDAASMYASNRSGSGAWKKTLESWQSKSFVTTVPAAEWGIEEEKFTQETGLVANVLSAEGLAALPTALFAEGMVGQVPASPAGELDVPALPSIMRRDPERWVLESPPDDEEWMDLQSALVGYLGISGWRWLCACAVYPVIEWDLTVALGQVLKGADKDPLFSESRAARLSELPWMRAGEMPDWLRSRLIDEIDQIDREAVRDLIAKILEAVDSEQKSGGDSISLKFGYLQGREPDSDERFVDFVTRAPESMDQNALLATRKLRELLRPNILTRLVDPGALGWLVIGTAAAVIAWLIAPRYIGAPSHTGAWAPFLAMLVGPVLAWFTWRRGKDFWDNRPNESASITDRAARLGGYIVTWVTSFIGLAKFNASRMLIARPQTFDGTAKLLRRRVEVWTLTLMLAALYLVGMVGILLIGVMWRVLFAPIAGWLALVLNSLVGEIILSALLIVALYFAARLGWRLLRRLYGISVRIADRASLRRHDLSHQPGGHISRSAFVGTTVFNTATGALLLIVALTAISPSIQTALLTSIPFNLAVLTAFALIMVGTAAWHFWTLRRYAEALETLEQTDTDQGPAMKVAA